MGKDDDKGSNQDGQENQCVPKEPQDLEELAGHVAKPEDGGVWPNMSWEDHRRRRGNGEPAFLSGRGATVKRPPRSHNSNFLSMIAQ